MTDHYDSDSTIAPGTSPSTPATSIARSNSTFSATSGLSHVYIPAIGSYPFGSLHVHRADSPLSRQALANAAAHHDMPASAPGPLGGDVVLVLDLPENFTVGYDSVSFRARSFRGVKEIPPGAHFFWASEDDAGSTRTGFWLIADRPEQIHVVQWDRYNDVLGEPASKTEARCQRADVADVLPSLPPYHSPVPRDQLPAGMAPGLDDLGENGIWARLTTHVTARMLGRVTGSEAGPWHVHTTDRVEGTTTLASERELDRHVSVVAVNPLAFTFSQADRTYAANSTGAARSEQARDATAYMIGVIDGGETRLTDDDVVGELQLAFLVGMHLGNEGCVLQWWHVVLRVFLRAHSLAGTKPFLAAKFLRALAAQLKYDDTRLEGSVFEFGSGLEKDLRISLTVYKRRLDELLRDDPSASQLDVGVAFSELEAVVVAGFGWDLGADYVRKGRVMLEDGEEVEVEMDELEAEDERGEFAATVVATDEGGRQVDLVSWD